MAHLVKLRGRRGFTRIELLVVTTMTAVLALIVVAAVEKARESDLQKACQNNLRQIGDGIFSYTTSNQDKLPPMLDYSPVADPARWQPFWFSVVSHMKTSSEFNGVKGSDAWDNGNHAAVVRALLCPADLSTSDGISPPARWAVTSYAPVYSLFGAQNIYNKEKDTYITRSRYNFANVPDGTAYQIAVVERFGHFPSYGWSNTVLYPCSHSQWYWSQWGSVYGFWGHNLPQTGVRPPDANPYYPNSAHSRAQVLLLDGSVRGISPSITAKTWASACIPDDVSVEGKWE